MTEITQNTIEERKKAHDELCETTEKPNFAGAGACPSCGKNVFEHYDGSTYITGCPFCYHSFCE